MKRLLFLLLLFPPFLANTQTLNPFYQGIVADVQYDSVLTHLQHFESLGTKSLSSQALRNTADWLCNEYTAMGYTDVVRDTFSYSGNTLQNIIVTKTGTIFPNKYLIVCGHYDTNGGTGTNDNGSGVSIILEIARLLQPLTTEYSVKFINFSAEEAGLVGSDHYVSHTVVTQNLDLLLVFNIDEVGGVAGETNNTITCEYDNSFPSSNNLSSQHYTDTLETLTGLYSALLTQQNYAYGSDYMSFEDNGEIITGFYESNESTYVHSASDLLSHVDTSYVVEIAKAATGASLYFSKAYQVYVGIPVSAPHTFSVFPNPCREKLILRTNGTVKAIFTLYDARGAMLQTIECNAAETVIDLSAYAPSLFYYTITSPTEGLNQSGKLIRQ
jgi:hypothetical protein